MMKLLRGWKFCEEIETVIMTKDELKKFLELEKEHWKKAD